MSFAIKGPGEEVSGGETPPPGPGRSSEGANRPQAEAASRPDAGGARQDLDVLLWNLAVERIFGSRELPAVLRPNSSRAAGEGRALAVSAEPMGVFPLLGDVRPLKEAEDRLLETTGTLTAMLQASPLAVVLLDVYGKVKMWNRAAQAIFGWQEEEVLDQPYPIVPQDRFSEFRANHEAVLRGGTFDSVEAQRRRKDGSLIDVSFSAAPLRDPSNNVRGAVVLLWDITERKRTERALQESEARHREVASSIPGVVYQLRLKPDGSVSFPFVSEGAYAISGVTPEEVQADASAIFSRVPGEDLPLIDRAIAESAKSMTTASLEFRILRPDGQVKWVRTVATPHALGDGSVLWNCVGLDITDRKHAEEALRASEERYRSIFEGTTEAILRGAVDGRPLAANPAAAHLLGFESPEELLGISNVAELYVDPAVREQILRLIEAHEKARGILVQLRRRDGRVIWVSANVRAIRDSHGALLGIEGMLTDSTERMEATVERERLYQEVHAGRERLAKLSRQLFEAQEAERRGVARELHDQLGQLLTGLKLTLEMAAGRVPEASASLVEAKNLVNDLMKRTRDLSLALRPPMLDDLGLLPSLLWLFERCAADTGVRVTFEHAGLEGRFPPEVETAAYRIAQEALTNVARHGGVLEATVRLWADSDTLCVQIEDRGKGFDFNAALAGGTSGLSGMRERALLLGGQFTAESAPTAGARLTAELPLRESLERRGEER